MVSLSLWAPAAVLDGIEIRVSTREGGVSLSPYDNFNLADHVGDKAESVDENRRRLAEALPGHAGDAPRRYWDTLQDALGHSGRVRDRLWLDLGVIWGSCLDLFGAIGDQRRAPGAFQCAPGGPK